MSDSDETTFTKSQTNGAAVPLRSRSETERHPPNGVAFLASRATIRLAAAALASGIFLFDILSPVEGAVAVLYVLVVLIAARTARRSDIIVATVAGLILTIIAYVDSHGFIKTDSSTLRAVVSLSAISIAGLLAAQNQHATAAIASQAKLLNLSHDMIFVRDNSGRIVFWNRAAEEVYGWSAPEAVGRSADELLETQYPIARTEVDAHLAEAGRWEGTLEQKTKNGSRIIVESRWAAQQDPEGRTTAILETDTDVTDRKAAYAALIQSERRYRRMFDASRIGVVEEDWTALRAELTALQLTDPATLSNYLASNPDFPIRARKLAKIVDLNPALLSMVGATSASKFFDSADDLLSENDRTFAAAITAFARGDAFHEGETEIIGIDGQRVPVLFAITFPAPDDEDGHVLVFVVDITERKQSQNALLMAQTELAHAARVATLGELTASIAHEVNQPLMAVVTSGEAGLRWLRRTPPDMNEVESAVSRIVSEGRRASEIVKRIRGFLVKAAAHQTELHISSIIDEAIQLVQHELSRAGVDLRIELEPDLPNLVGDRIQLQQVLVNLIVNAGQAMADHPGTRLLSIQAASDSIDTVSIVVRDTGPGIAEMHIGKLFTPFFTTKQQGMGMGLAICRTIAEAHGGHLSVTSTPDQGATFRLDLPAPPKNSLS